ncbi:UNVERIFIED_CONTAM: hypothetical protein Slati_1759500 [Sesamum latifolium]|uniref:Reverse transcriptase n=1 Tax=Sesamum latifolium TaxID=2727402 RepID=A0AAW2WYA1_9LAMI
MPGLDPKVALHHLSVKKGARPIKQGQRRFRPELIPLIEGKVNKLIEVGFIREVKYPMWISSIVSVRKKNGQIRSKKREDHLYDLMKVFECLRRYQLKMNPSKCAFGVTSDKFLGFIVRQWGIEIEQAKIDAISRIRLMKKDVPFEWDETCDKEFKSIKSYLMKPPVLIAPVHGRPLILRVAAQKRSANPLKYVMMKLVLLDRLPRWYLQLQQFEITCVPQKVVKVQVLADHPMPAEWELFDDLLDEDVLVIEITPP